MSLTYEMYRMSADSFAALAEPEMQPFWDGYKEGLHARFHDGQPEEVLQENKLHAKGYRAGLEGIPAVSLIPMLLKEDFP